MLLPVGLKQFMDGNGTPVVAGSVGYYQPGTGGMVLRPIWADEPQTIPVQNPVPLDSAGRPFSGGSEVAIWGNGQYEEIVRDSTGAVISTCVLDTPLGSSGNLVVNGNLTVTGNESVGGSLAVGQGISAGGDIVTGSNIDAGGTIGASGNIISASNVEAAGNVIANGNVDAGGNLSGAGILAQNGIISGHLTVAGSFEDQGPSLFDGPMQVNGTVTAQGFVGPGIGGPGASAPTVHGGSGTLDFSGHAHITFPTAFPTAVAAAVAIPDYAKVLEYAGQSTNPSIISTVTNVATTGFDYYIQQVPEAVGDLGIEIPFWWIAVGS